MADEEATEGKEGEEGGAKKGKSKLIIIIVIVVLVLGGIGASAALLLGGGGDGEGHDDEHHADEHYEAEKHYETAPLDTFIVNLSEATSFLKVEIILEYDPEIFAKASEHGGGGAYGGGGAGGGGEPAGPVLPHQITEREPMIRDAVIRVLSSKTPAQVLSVDGKEQLKEELIEAINEALGLEEGPIVGVYFKEFIIQ